MLPRLQRFGARLLGAAALWGSSWGCVLVRMLLGRCVAGMPHAEVDECDFGFGQTMTFNRYFMPGDILSLLVAMIFLPGQSRKARCNVRLCRDCERIVRRRRIS